MKRCSGKQRRRCGDVESKTYSFLFKVPVKWHSPLVAAAVNQTGRCRVERMGVRGNGCNSKHCSDESGKKGQTE